MSKFVSFHRPFVSRHPIVREDRCQGQGPSDTWWTRPAMATFAVGCVARRAYCAEHALIELVKAGYTFDEVALILCGRQVDP